MTKKYNVVPVEDYYVVVDKEKEIIANVTPVINAYLPHYAGSTCLSSLSKSKPFDATGKIDLFKGIDAIVATIGKRIDNLPLIEIPEDSWDDPRQVDFSRFFLDSEYKKPITAVELELLDTPKDLADDFEIGGGDTSYTKWVNTLKIDKNNIIHPVNVFYEIFNRNT